MIEIDGSQGEGGGQILRTSLALSLVTRQPFRLVNIRARRAKPGLMRQHLTAVQAAQQVGNATVRGAAIGSAVLTFEPGPVAAGTYFIQIGTAGSTTLVLQTVLPPLLACGGESRLRIEGGTHNMMAPPFDFLERSFAPLLNQTGADVRLTLHRHGFFPAGGGAISAEIMPPGSPCPLNLLERGRLVSRSARALVSQIPGHVAERELAIVRDRLGWSPGDLHAVRVRDARGPGNVLMLEAAYEHVTEVVTAFGEKGVSAERVARAACDEMDRYLESDAPVGPHLADQLLLPMALRAGGAFRATELTPHTLTNIEIIRRFLDIEIAVMPEPGASHRIEVSRR